MEGLGLCTCYMPLAYRLPHGCTHMVYVPLCALYHTPTSITLTIVQAQFSL